VTKFLNFLFSIILDVKISKNGSTSFTKEISIISLKVS